MSHWASKVGLEASDRAGWSSRAQRLAGSCQQRHSYQPARSHPFSASSPCTVAHSSSVVSWCCVGPSILGGMAAAAVAWVGLWNRSAVRKEGVKIPHENQQNTARPGREFLE